jgi:hypothetical protein
METINFWGIGLYILWSFSLLGGLSSARLVIVVDEPRDLPAAITYLDSNNTPELSKVVDDQSVLTELPSLKSIFISFLLNPASVMSSRMDAWGNVKVPSISQLPGKANTTGRIDVPSLEVYYTSLTDILLSGIPQSGNATFTLQSIYLELDCSEMNEGSPIKTINATDVSSGFNKSTDNQFFGGDGTQYRHESDSCFVSSSLCMNHFGTSFTTSWQKSHSSLVC